MDQQDCTHTMTPRAQSALALLLALAWFALRRLGRGCRRAAEIGLLWTERAQQRRALGQLSDHMLRDIGVTRADAWAEADKPFWRR
jgi:uncharacterized protein YjiS (DUF1127 family)